MMTGFLPMALLVPPIVIYPTAEITLVPCCINGSQAVSPCVEKRCAVYVPADIAHELNAHVRAVDSIDLIVSKITLAVRFPAQEYKQQPQEQPVTP